jgi:short subunit dehydrogenase-like uncharacterized protein
MTVSRPHDLVLYGATGFTGGLVADYLADRLAGTDVRWALAGRSQPKLAAVRAKLGARRPELADLPLLQAHAGDDESLRDMAARTRVVISTVGPFALHGEPLVRACVEHGTDYVDITGEPSFWTKMIERYHEAAIESGSIVVSCCGFDSIPHDLGVLFAMQQLGPVGDEPIRVCGYVSAVGDFSGGTFNSALHAFAEGTGGTSPSGPKPRSARKARIHFSEDIGQWVAPLPTIDPMVVRRSAQLVGDAYGAQFSYSHFLQAKDGLGLAKIVAGVGALVVAAKIPIVRRRLAAMRPSGSGPSAEARARHWFRVHIVARQGDRRVRVEVRGGDPGYTETAKMVAESALCLVQDRAALPRERGVLTPASAFGSRLIERLQAAGMDFRVVDGPPVGSGRLP